MPMTVTDAPSSLEILKVNQMIISGRVIPIARRTYKPARVMATFPHPRRSLGPVGNLETEMATIMIENELPIGAGFSEGILKEQPAPSPHYVMEKEEVARRRDLRWALREAECEARDRE